MKTEQRERRRKTENEVLREALIKALGFIDLAIGVPRTEIQDQIRAALNYGRKTTDSQTLKQPA